MLRHVEEVSFNVAATCRYYGISRQCYYGWLRRYEADGLDGLKDRSSRPHNSPRVTQAEVIEKIVWLRKHYHFGPAKIAMYLARYHDLTISISGVWRILKRLGMNRLPASQRYQRRALRWKRYEKQRPGHQLQVDVKFIEPLGQTGRRNKYYQFTAIDDCTRLRVLRAYPRCDQKTAIAFIDHVMAKLPFAVERVQTDIQAMWCPEVPGLSGRRCEDRWVRHPPIVVASPIGARRDSLPVDHVGVRGLLPETGHPVRNLATAPNSPRIPVSECLVRLVLMRQRAVDGS